MTVALLLDYNDVNQIKSLGLFGSSDSLVPVQVGNKSGFESVDNNGTCSQIYYLVPSGTIRYPKDLGEEHNGDSIVVITFDGCSTGTALNQDQDLINKILDTFSIK